MKKGWLKSIIIVVMVALIVATFSACNAIKDFFGGLTDTPDKPATPVVTSVNIIHKNGLEENEDGTLVAVVGEPFTLDIVLNEGAPEIVEYKWYISSGGQTTLIGDSKVLEYTFRNCTEETYKFYATADGVESANKISVTLKYSEKLVGTGISSTTHEIHEGIVQQFKYNIQAITLVAEWDADALPEGSEVAFAWTMGDSAEILSTESEFSFTPPEVGIYEINLVLTYQDDTVEHTLQVVVIEGFLPTENVVITLEKGAEAFGSGVETQYYHEVNSEKRDEITLTLDTTPIGKTDYNAPVTWIVRDRDGERVLSETGRSVTFEPKYGETIVKAIVDNVESKNVVIFEFTPADKAKYEKYMNEVFVWVDGVENAYITDQIDLDRLIQYAFSTRKVFDGTKDSGFIFATASNFDFIQNRDDQPLKNALETIDESGNISVNRSYSYNEVTGETFDYVLYITDEAMFMTPSKNYSPAVYVVQDENAIVHYTLLDESEKRTSLPIDDNPEYNEPIKNSQMLYRVIGWGYKPVFDNSAESQKMKALYDSIRKVALDYMTDEMSDYKKTLIIYEWISQNVDYDYAIAEADLEQFESLGYNAFSLEGVFCDADGEGYGQAVCDGRAKAFVALCGVEDIKAIRIAGDANVNGVNEKHAWNKVLIDINGDGTKEWFMCDTTWSDRSSTTDRTERMNKQYFLVTDEYIERTHIANANYFNPACVTYFDYYANTIIENGDDDFDLYINTGNKLTGSDELKCAVKYAKENDIMLEIKVSTSVCKTESELRYLLSMRYAIGVDYEIYTIENASDYNIFTIVFA